MPTRKRPHLAEVVPLFTTMDAQRESAIERLEFTLAQVRAGEVLAVAIALVKSNGAAGGAYSSAENGINLLGSIELLKHRIAAELHDASVETPGQDEPA